MSLNLYPIIKKIGKSGFGTTYLATNTLLPNRPKCVVKQLIPTSNDPRLQQLLQDRFKHEAITLENLSKGSNGKIPTLYHYFVEQGDFYLVQEYIDGQTLTEKVNSQGRFTETQVRQILNDILATLSYVHQKSIIHRDIKPDNIMVRYSDDKPVLIDFGAVKEIMSTVMIGAENTARSIVIGTPGFMPVEQMSGRPMFASDIYALGMTAIYLLTGRMPQEIETDPDTGNIKWQVYAPNVSLQLLEIINKSIQPVSNYRYNNAQAMLHDLNNSQNKIAQAMLHDISVANTVTVIPMIGSHQEQAYIPGKILFNTPNQMKMGIPERVSIRIAKKLTYDFFEDLIHTQEVEVENIRVSQFMAASLRGDDFKIEALGNEEQIIEDNDFTQWDWKIVPLKSGNRKLWAIITIRVKVENEQGHKTLPVLEKEISVKINPAYSTSTFFVQYWQWLIASAMIPIIGLLLKK